MSFRKLSINRDLIDNCIKSFVGDSSKVTVTQNPKNNQIVYTVDTPQQAKATLNVYTNTDGTTTLQFNIGSNQDYSEKIAVHVKSNCSFPEIPATDFYFRGLEEDEFDAVVDFLETDCDCVVLQEVVLSYGKQKRIQSPQGDTLVFNYYDTKSALHIQGAPRLLFHNTIDILSELLPDKFEEIIEQQLKYYQIDISKDEVLNELAHRVPVAYDGLESKLKSIISPSLALLRVQLELTDYFALVSPVLKGLEGVLKQIFAEHGIHIGKDGFGEYFTYDHASGKHTLNQDAKADITKPKVQVSLGVGYSYFAAKRHELFHVDGNVSTSKVISSRREAEEIINSTLNIIEQSFVALNN